MLSGDEDPGLFQNIDSVNERFGGNMQCTHVAGAMGWLKRFTQKDAGDGHPGRTVHLTMYGEPYREAIPKIHETVRSSLLLEVPRFHLKPLSTLITMLQWETNPTQRSQRSPCSWKHGLVKAVQSETSLTHASSSTLPPQQDGS